MDDTRQDKTIKTKERQKNIYMSDSSKQVRFIRNKLNVGIWKKKWSKSYCYNNLI